MTIHVHYAKSSLRCGHAACTNARLLGNSSWSSTVLYVHSWMVRSEKVLAMQCVIPTCVIPSVEIEVISGAETAPVTDKNDKIKVSHT
jgi:hypothetical protein